MKDALFMVASVCGFRFQRVHRLEFRIWCGKQFSRRAGFTTGRLVKANRSQYGPPTMLTHRRPVGSLRSFQHRSRIYSSVTKRRLR